MKQSVGVSVRVNILFTFTRAMASSLVITQLVFTKNEPRFENFEVVCEVGPPDYLEVGNAVQQIQALLSLSAHERGLQFL